ncbi:Putative nuclease HARBI1 [Linum grandiflorum]
MGLESVEGHITWVTLDTELPRGFWYHLDSNGTILVSGEHLDQTHPHKYYNMKHSSARNVIERTFRVLKKKWAILRDTTWFSPDLVAQIVNACCLLHNFILQEQRIQKKTIWFCGT